MKQFEDVNCKYGAPMGRWTEDHIERLPHHTISVFKVRLYDGYDDGGAYWGAAIHGVKPLYCARGYYGHYQQFIRANSRKEAIELLNIPAIYLKRA